MRQVLFLALRSLAWYAGRGLTIVLCLALTLWLPVSLRLLLNQFQREITARADATPLIVGAPGSRVDLALHALYFESAPPALTTMAEVTWLQTTGLATAIPLHIRYRTQGRDGADGVPIIGTSQEYFGFRGLSVAEGRMLSLLGECVVGAEAAERLSLSPGDTILSAPKNAFNLAGDYPLKLHVVGVLQPSHSPDDDALFTDVQTTWVIDGIGHGHQTLTQETNPDLLLKSDDDTVVANAAVLPYTEITPENIGSFHFHGDTDTFPLSAVIAVPDSDRNRILLQGRYVSVHRTALCLKPPEVVAELMSVVFRVEQLVWISSLLAAAVTATLIGLVLFLSLRLRAAEIQTLFKLGASRRVTIGLLATEVALLLAFGILLALLGAVLTQYAAADGLRRLLF